ncbi:hypothetical protein LguiA_007397 [Lonicera macranthoides]
MAPPGSSIYELCSFVSVICVRRMRAPPGGGDVKQLYQQREQAIFIDRLLKGYSAYVLLIVETSQAAASQLQGTTSDHVQIFNIELKAKMKSHCMPEQRNKFGRNIIGFRPVIDLAFMRDVVNKLSIIWKVRLLDHHFPKAVAQVALTLRSTWEVNLEFHGRVVFNADSVLGTDSRTSMNYSLKSMSKPAMARSSIRRGVRSWLEV